MMTLVVLGAPFIAHVGAVGSDIWRPKAKGLLKGGLGEFLVRRINTVLFLNGLLFASAYVLWRNLEGPFFAIPLLLSVPTVVAQVVLAAESGRQSTHRSLG
jgi:hypothetical protein